MSSALDPALIEKIRKSTGNMILADVDFLNLNEAVFSYHKGGKGPHPQKLLSFKLDESGNLQVFKEFKTPSLPFSTSVSFDPVTGNPHGLSMYHHYDLSKSMTFETPSDRVAKSLKLASAMNRLVRTEKSLFALGFPNRVLRFVGENQWESLGPQVTPEDINRAYEKGMVDQLAFNELIELDPGHFWAAGGLGALWECQAGRWHQRSFPELVKIQSLAASPEGNLYALTSQGSRAKLYVGDGTRWRVVKDRALVSVLKFQKQMIYQTDVGILALDSKGRETVLLPERSQILKVSGDGRHLLAVIMSGKNRGLYTYDGAEWRPWKVLDFSEIK